MIHFQDTDTKNDTPELLRYTEYQNIKPSAPLSKEQAIRFWDNRFADTFQEEDRESCEEDIWGEIFGRDENEFTFDFEIDENLRALLDRFNSAKWDTLCREERMEVICQFVQLLSDKLELTTAPDIVLFDGPPTLLGAFNPNENCIELNAELLDRPDFLKNVIPHEIRHAYQHQRSNMQETRMDMLYHANFDNYIDPVWLSDHTCLFFTDYQDQLVEAEARAFANLFS